MSVNLKIVVTFCLLTLVAALLALPKVTLGYASDNSTISVNVGQASEITVLPTSLSWSGVAPGTESSSQTLDIKNTGSENVSQIHAYVTTITNETTRPYGTDEVSNYAATGVIMISNESNATIYFAGRKEWNWTENVSYMNLVNLGAGACKAGYNCSWGFIRNTSYEYLWAASNGTSVDEAPFCNFTDAQLLFENDTDTGAVDGSTRTPDAAGMTANGADLNFSYWSMQRGDHFLSDSCIALHRSCQWIYLYKFDRRSSADNLDFDTCSNSRDLQQIALPPRDVHTVTLNVYMPVGIPDGDMAAGGIYVEAKA